MSKSSLIVRNRAHNRLPAPFNLLLGDFRLIESSLDGCGPATSSWTLFAGFALCPLVQLLSDFLANVEFAGEFRLGVTLYEDL